MSAPTTGGLWRDEWLGLAMIAASLLAICVIVGLITVQQRDGAEARAHARAVGLTRLLSAMPYEQLNSQAGGLQALARSQPANELAYAVLLDTQGAVVNQVLRPGVIVPPPELPESETAGLTQRVVPISDSSESREQIFEYQAPLIVDGRTRGYIRLGFFRPGDGLQMEQVPFFATIALVVFLLAPAFYLLVRRELRPIGNIVSALDKIVQSGDFERIRSNGSSTVADFLERFNSFSEFAETRLQELNSQNAELLTGAKLLGYQKQRLARVLEALPDAVLLLDEEGAVSFANGKLHVLLGVAPETVIGRRPEEWCEDRKIVNFINRFESKSLARQLSESLEFAPAGAPDKTFALRIWPLLSPQFTDTRSGTLLIFRDVTLESLASRSGGEFVAHLAHELKTPLNVLAMYSERLQDDDAGDESFRIEAVNAISDEVQRLATLIDNLLNITRIELGSLKLERQRVNLKDLLQDAFNHVARSGQAAGLKFALEVPDNLPAASLDKNLLRVALNNLLTNAIKYSHPGGQVTMSAEETDDLIRICVSDTGVGIKADDQERIFDRFFRADDEQVRSRSGHGLGLSLARDIVHLHHGALRVESEPGHGSKFYIELWKDSVMIRQAS